MVRSRFARSKQGTIQDLEMRLSVRRVTWFVARGCGHKPLPDVSADALHELPGDAGGRSDAGRAVEMTSRHPRHSRWVLDRDVPVGCDGSVPVGPLLGQCRPPGGAHAMRP